MTKPLALFAGLALALLAQPLQAQAPLIDVRIGAQTAAPTGDLASVYEYGFGAYARVGVPVGPISLMGSVTWTRFKPDSPSLNDLDIATLQLGPHFAVARGLDFGLEGAYFTEVEKFGLAPNVSIGLSNLEATLSYNTTLDGPRTSWIALGIGLKF